MWHEDVEFTLTFAHVTAIVSPTPSVIPTITVVDATPFSVVPVAVTVPVPVLVTGITAIVTYMYIVAPFTC